MQRRDRTPACLREIEDTTQGRYRIQADAAWKKQCKGWGDSTAKEPSVMEMQWTYHFGLQCSSASLRGSPAGLAPEAVRFAIMSDGPRLLIVLVIAGLYCLRLTLPALESCCPH